MALIHVLLLRRDSTVAAFLAWETDPFLWFQKIMSLDMLVYM